ncbi:MAG: radical SAM protein [Planctomycetes bacterium]|nr:radical SAM protein [Planctomycetota bacterium]
MSACGLAVRAWGYWRRNGRYWTLRKAANALLARAARRLRWTWCPSGPVVAKIEATNVCNGDCRLCPVGRGDPGRRPGGMMDWELYRKLIDAVRGTVVTVDLTNWGESLLHGGILDMIRYAHEARMYTYLSTNLHTVRDGHVEGLMTCGLDELALSLHGLSEATYRAYQPGYAFGEALAQIERLVDARRRLGRDGKPKIKINFVVTAKNHHEVEDVPAFAARLGVQYVLSEASLNLRFKVPPEMARRRPDEARAIMRPVIDEWVPPAGRCDRAVYRELLDDPAAMYDPRKRFGCDWPWRTLVVNWDGAASICCGSFHADDDVGRYTGGPIGRLWNSLPYRRCRRAFRRRRGEAAGVLCEQCPGVLL